MKQRYALEESLEFWPKLCPFLPLELPIEAVLVEAGSLALEAQALANSIWHHGARGVTQVKKVNEVKSTCCSSALIFKENVRFHSWFCQHDRSPRLGSACLICQHRGHAVRDSSNGSTPHRDTPIQN